MITLLQGNKSSRALALDAKFTNTKLIDFPNVKAYCTRLKVLSDNMANIRHKISDERLVLRLLRGLTDDYKHFQTTVPHRVPLPSFEVVRSMLDLEEENNSDELTTDTGSTTALLSHHVANESFSVNGKISSYNSTQNRGNSSYKGKKNHRNRGGGGKRNNRGGGGNGGGGGNPNNHQATSNQLPRQQANAIPPQCGTFLPWLHGGHNLGPPRHVLILLLVGSNHVRCHHTSLLI